MALTSAARMTVIVMVFGSTTSCPIVFATATPKMNGPDEIRPAPSFPRQRADEKARDEIIVATTLLESCTPFRKSKPRASTITAIRIGAMNDPDYASLTTMSAITLAASSPRSAALLRWR